VPAPPAARGVRNVPRNPGPNVTLLAALTPTGLTAPMVLAGTVDRAAFDGSGAQALVPTLRPGQVVVRDNLSVPKGERTRTLIEQAGARLLFLPAYSPDFNPIEPAFGKVKDHLRRLAARTVDGWNGRSARHSKLLPLPTPAASSPTAAFPS